MQLTRVSWQSLAVAPRSVVRIQMWGLRSVSSTSVFDSRHNRISVIRSTWQTPLLKLSSLNSDIGWPVLFDGHNYHFIDSTWFAPQTNKILHNWVPQTQFSFIVIAPDQTRKVLKKGQRTWKASASYCPVSNMWIISQKHWYYWDLSSQLEYSIQIAKMLTEF